MTYKKIYRAIGTTQIPNNQTEEKKKYRRYATAEDTIDIDDTLTTLNFYFSLFVKKIYRQPKQFEAPFKYE